MENESWKDYLLYEYKDKYEEYTQIENVLNKSKNLRERNTAYKILMLIDEVMSLLMWAIKRNTRLVSLWILPDGNTIRTETKTPPTSDAINIVTYKVGYTDFIEHNIYSIEYELWQAGCTSDIESASDKYPEKYAEVINKYKAIFVIDELNKIIDRIEILEKQYSIIKNYKWR